MNEIQKVLDKAIEQLNNKRKSISNNELSYKDLKKLSIEKLNKNERVEGKWIELANKVIDDEKSIMPLEAYLMLAKEVNNDASLYNIVNVDGLNNYVINTVFNEVAFNLSGATLIKLIKEIPENNSVSYKKKIITSWKCSKFKKIKLREIEDEIVTLGIKINNINKIEIAKYEKEYDNYYFIPNEAIEIYDFYKDNDLISIKENAQPLVIKSNYQILCDLLRESKEELDLNNAFHRILLYGVAKELSVDFKTYFKVGQIRNEVVDLIISNEDLFSKNYIELIYKNVKINNSFKYIEELESNPTNQKLKDIFERCDTIDDIFEILKYGQTLMGDKISIDTYVNAILKCNKIDNHSIKIALFCEELLIERPLIIDEIVHFLKEMYSENVFTENTLKILDYLSCTIKDNKLIEETRVKIKADNGVFDNDFLNKFIKVYNETENKEVLDDIVNKIVNHKSIEYSDKLISAIYGFYRRNNDLNALDKLCTSLYNRKAKINNKLIETIDIEKMLDLFNINDKVIGREDYLLSLINEFSESTKILSQGKEILEKLLNSCNNELIKRLYKKYFNLFKKLKKESEIIYVSYVIGIIENRNEKIIDLESEIDELNKLILPDHELLEEKLKNSVILLLFNYYTENKNYDNALKVLQIYLDEYMEIDYGKTFREILTNSYKNIEIIEQILNFIDFSKVKNVEGLLNLISNELIKVKRYESLGEVLRYYIGNEKFNESVFATKEYLNNADDIDEITYTVFISEILRNLEEHIKKELYNIIINREDCPIEIREEFFYLNPNDKNKDRLIREFEKGNTTSSLSKELTLTHYYNDNNVFSELAHIGENNEKVFEIIWNKVKKEFKDNKEFVEDVLRNISDKDERLKQIYLFTQNYSENMWDYENRIIFGEYKLDEKVIGELCYELELSNVFSNELLKGIYLKDNNIRTEFDKYFRNKSINFSEIDFEVISIDEEDDEEFIKSGELSKLLSNIKDLVSLQQKLLSNERIMIEFLNDSFIINEKAFIPKSFKNISEYTGEFISRETEIFPNINNIKNRNGSIIVNERNIVILLQNYISNILIKRKDSDENLAIKKKLIETVLLNTEVTTIQGLLEELSKFIDDFNKSFEEISYRKLLKDFKDLSNEDKNKVMNKVIEKQDITPLAKRIIVDKIGTKSASEDFEFDDIQNKYGLFKYLIECFNNAQSELTIEDFESIYVMVNKMINEITKDLNIDELKYEIENLYINAHKQCKYKKKDVCMDVSQLNIPEENKNYIINRVMKS
ncbi:hypothetical protein ACN077_23735 [Clostridium chromiireducens]|uniref:hypothetical protein n=1 Tax=Clostridium chromiireducens TaxID=225345 RepID=UPI003AF9297E